MHFSQLILHPSDFDFHLMGDCRFGRCFLFRGRRRTNQQAGILFLIDLTPGRSSTWTPRSTLAAAGAQAAVSSNSARLQDRNTARRELIFISRCLSFNAALYLEIGLSQDFGRFTCGLVLLLLF